MSACVFLFSLNYVHEFLYQVIINVSFELIYIYPREYSSIYRST